MIKDGILGIPPVLVRVTGVSWDLLDCYVVLLLQLREPIEYQKGSHLGSGHITKLPICTQGGGPLIKDGLLGILPVQVLLLQLRDPLEYYKGSHLGRGHISTLPICTQGGGHTDKGRTPGDSTSPSSSPSAQGPPKILQGVPPGPWTHFNITYLYPGRRAH